MELDCDNTYSGSNQFGTDAIVAYQCENVLNVDNNGNEVIHSFHIPDFLGLTDVTITLSNLNRINWKPTLNPKEAVRFLFGLKCWPFANHFFPKDIS